LKLLPREIQELTVKSKFISLNDKLYDYVVRSRSRTDDPLLNELRTETEALGDVARMLISREQGDFLTMMTKLLNVHTAVEVGTFTGYSSICIGRGLAAGGRLTCFDINEEWAAIAQRYWAKANLSERLELQLGNAAQKLTEWKPFEPLDFAFIDADKTAYDTYFEILLPGMKTNGLFIFDNMLWGGRITEQPLTDPDGVALDNLNCKLANDSRVESVLLAVADGVQIVRKK
jgi:caffeoyl-CoA O-methyltransferase